MSVGTAEAPAAPSRRRRFRGPVLIGAVVAAALVVLFTLPRADRDDLPLDPQSAGPSGSRAVVALLGDQGVRVERADTTAEAEQRAAAGTTLLVAEPWRLSIGQLDRLARLPASVVLVEPDHRGLRVAPGVSAEGGSTDRDSAAPGTCTLTEGSRAGDVDAGGLLYSITPADGAASCYPQDSDEGGTAAGVVQTVTAGRTVTILGNSAVLTNERLGERGNAALALGVLGRTRNLTWYLSSPQDAPVDGQSTLTEVLPPGVRYATLMSVLAVVVLAFWRGRRLGPVVVEPLPILVRATETTEGRARLYRRARARGRAAEALRSAARHRLRLAMGLGRRHPPEALVDAVATRTGRSPAEVAVVLGGAAPTDDRGLVHLAQNLDFVEREVRRP